MNDILRQIRLWGIVPVVKIDDAKDAVPLAKALCDGGLPLAEITYRTAAARDAIAAVTKAYPDMLVGAGTVLTTSQVDEAVSVGARFIVAPGFNPEVVGYCVKKGIPVTPGCSSPSDIERAIGFGLDVVKFFPAEDLGGLRMIKALSAPYVGVKFMPTGGINAGNICEYLASDKIWACGGSWMVKSDLIASGRFDEIERLTREAVSVSLGFRFDHVGVNSRDESVCRDAADRFTSAFGFAQNELPVSIFAGSGIELMKAPGRGSAGHIAIATHSVDRAVNQLSRRGVAFDMNSVQLDKNGDMRFIYLRDEFAGYAVHLVKD